MNDSDEANDRDDHISGCEKASPGHCPNVKKCSLFPYFSYSSLVSRWKDEYCYRAYIGCARYKSFVAGIEPPKNLLPSGALMQLEVGNRGTECASSSMLLPPRSNFEQSSRTYTSKKQGD